MRYLLMALLWVTPAFADCPATPDRSEDLAALSAAAVAAPNEAAGRSISGQMWEIWLDAPDETAQEMLDRGMGARRSYDFLTALGAFNDLVDYCPAYAEGYNQRAFVRFLTQDYTAAIADLELALEREPGHVAALSGLALSLLGLGRDAEAQIILRRALALNPWIPERGLLREPEGEPL